ncbi:MAG: cobalamin biosynthesis protein CobD [Nitrospirae bacterium]|nr:MAG: cobalamin biosynthesis protein CobD [Nitrospirota bacterium]
MNAANLLMACTLDCVLGDPRWMPHPVRLLGWGIRQCERGIRRMVVSPARQRMAGCVMACGIPASAYVAGEWAIDMGYSMHPVVGDGLWVVLAYTTVAARDLADHALAVYRALRDGELEEARRALSKIVGRDTALLSESEVVRASVETVAENTSDGVIAPLMYLALGGPALALAYKAVNTLDSMIGYRTPEYEHIGWASAKVDDLVNWLPARISAVLIVIAAILCFRTGGEAWRIFRRDGAKHPSPNAGRPEAAMAGALQVRLGGTNTYQGIRVMRPTLGDPRRPLVPIQICRAVRLMWIVWGLGVVGAVLRYAV